MIQNLWLQTLGLLIGVCVVDAATFADDRVEELPPPRAAMTPDSEREPSPSDTRENSPEGWSLKGARGQHLFVGDVAMADYTWEGRRHIALLEQDPEQQTQSDPHFLYYHERQTGNRWAIGRYPSVHQAYASYYQPAGGPKVLTRFQEARLGRTNDRSLVSTSAIVVVESPIETVIEIEPKCDRQRDARLPGPH